jgi:2-oxoglutarate dehydrogenase E2 component (dihydrolipoamide succinyltransferase)
MARFELKLPKMGESVAEATITNWLKEVGDKIEADEAVLEIATDKVDSEVPSEVSGILVERLFGKDDLVQVGQTIAIIETEGDESTGTDTAVPEAVAAVEKTIDSARDAVASPTAGNSLDTLNSDKFFSPLVKNIAAAEGVTVAELDLIAGTGKEGRVTKNDILEYVKNKTNQPVAVAKIVEAPKAAPVAPVAQKATPVSVNGGDEIIEMDRMRKLISGCFCANVGSRTIIYRGRCD